LASELIPCLRDAIAYLEKRDIDGDSLLEQGPNEDWMDSMLRSGKIVYSQAAYLQSLQGWCLVLHKIGHAEEAERANQIARKVIRQVDHKLWRSDLSSYADMLVQDDYEAHNQSPFLTQDVSFFLMLENVREICDTTKANSSLDSLKKKLWTDLGPMCIQPPSKKTGPIKLGPNKYQNGGFWPWITSLEITARISYGRLDEGKLLLEKTLPYSALEWIDPYNTLSSGSYPFRTSIAAVRTALRKFQKIKKPKQSY
jgi:glycogen debranching enzyme